jgi:hypothetical protein
MMESTQDREGENLASFVIWWHWPSVRLWNLLPDTSMWSGPIEVLDIGIEHPLELLLMKDEQVIETLTSYTPQKALTDGIRSWGLIRCFENLDITRICNTGEVHPKLAIVIMNKILRPLSIRGGFSQLLR